MKTVNMLMFDADVVRYELPDTRGQVRGLFGMILTTNVLLAITLHPLLLYVIRPKFITRRRLTEG